MTKHFHLDIYFSNRDINGNVFSAFKITSNMDGESLLVWDQGKNAQHIMHKFFDEWGKWTSTDIWEKIRDFNRITKDSQFLRIEEIHEWMAQH